MSSAGAEPFDPAQVAYGVETETCTYLLDREGVCMWAFTPEGLTAPSAARCVGAQFVACLHPSVPGALVGELQLGAPALFARLEGGRFVLLKTAPIACVVERPPAPKEMPPPLPPIMPPPRRDKFAGFSPEAAAIARKFDAETTEDLDPDAVVEVEEIVTYTEVTLTFPLYQPDAEPPPGPRHGDDGEPPRILGRTPGRRLR